MGGRAPTHTRFAQEISSFSEPSRKIKTFPEKARCRASVLFWVCKMGVAGGSLGGGRPFSTHDSDKKGFAFLRRFGKSNHFRDFGISRFRAFGLSSFSFRDFEILDFRKSAFTRYSGKRDFLSPEPCRKIKNISRGKHSAGPPFSVESVKWGGSVFYTQF